MTDETTVAPRDVGNAAMTALMDAFPTSAVVTKTDLNVVKMPHSAAKILCYKEPFRAMRNDQRGRLNAPAGLTQDKRY